MKKKAVIIMLLTAMIINSLTGSVAMASGIDDNATGGGSSGSLNSGNGTLNWNQNKSGYRFSIIDKAGNVVSLGEDGKSGSVDALFMNYNDINTPYHFTNAKIQPLSNIAQNKRLSIEELNKIAGFNSLPPYPISTDGNGNAKGNGEALRLWMMDGKKWIGQRSQYTKPTKSTETVTPKENKTNSEKGTVSKENNKKIDIQQHKNDVIRSAKLLKAQLDKQPKMKDGDKLKASYSWMNRIASKYVKLYESKEITVEEYNDIVLNTALDMQSWLQYSSFKRVSIHKNYELFDIVHTENVLDNEIDTYIKNMKKDGIDNSKWNRRIDYYIEGEIAYYETQLQQAKISSKQSKHIKTYLNRIGKNNKKALTVSNLSEKNGLMHMSFTVSKETDTNNGMVQTLNYTNVAPVYYSSNATVMKDIDNSAIISLSTSANNNSSSTTEVEDKGEILKLLNADRNGKPLFELPEHSLPEYEGMNTVDIMVEKGYSLIVEPLTYIQPATWDSLKGGAGTYFKYHIFGTITNYAECLTLLKEKGYWSDMGGGAYSTPTSKLGWSALMTESDWEGDGITIKAPTKTKGTRRLMDELANASNLSKGTIEGFGMQLYMTNTDEEDDIPTPTTKTTLTPVITSGDSGIILYENEITKVSSLLDSYEGDSKKLKIQSSITGVTDKNHTVYLHDNHGTDEEGDEIPCSGHLCTVYMRDNSYNHIYGINKLTDKYKIIAKTKSFASKLLYNSTGVSTVGLSGNNNISAYPNYSFNLYRSMDVPTLVKYKNSSDIVKDLKELGLVASNGGSDYQSDRLDTGSNSYSFDVAMGKDGSSDTNTTYSHSLESREGSQTHTLGEAKHSVDVTVKTYTGEVNSGSESSETLADKFEINGYTFTNPSRYIITKEDSIVFYPYINMKYTLENKEKNAKVLSKDISVANNSDFIELGYAKTGKSSLNLLMESKQWNSHMRTRKFINDNDIKDRNSVLPGGSVYSLEEQPKNTTYVGVRTWQTIVPNSELNHVAYGADYFNNNNAKMRRNSLLEDINQNIKQYKLTQYIQEGIEKEQKKIIGDGTALNKIASGISQKVFDNQLSRDSKYYLRSNISTNKANSNAIFAVGDSNSQLVRTVEYTIKSDTEGKVYLYQSVNNKGSKLLGQIDKTKNKEDLIQQSEEIRELDDKTKLVTNFIASIDRNQGADENGNAWYNEAFDGISVILSEYMIEVGFTDGNGIGVSSRTSALDTKLCGLIESKSDIFNYNSDTAKDKVRSSCWGIYPTLPSKPKGYVAEVNWGDTVVPIQIRNIEYLFLSKTFYITNATVMDLN